MPDQNSLHYVTIFCTIPTQFLELVSEARNQPYVIYVARSRRFSHHICPSYSFHFLDQEVPEYELPVLVVDKVQEPQDCRVS